jgi:putative FmdB family regulatory protein
MPSYSYRCPNCGIEIELFQKITEKKSPQCDGKECKLVEMETVIKPGTFILKGSGWAKDGYS